MSQESEAITKTLITGSKIVAVVAIAMFAFIGAFIGFTTLFDNLGFTPGASGMLTMLLMWFIITAVIAFRWKYQRTLAEIKKRDENIMRGLRG